MHRVPVACCRGFMFLVCALEWACSEPMLPPVGHDTVSATDSASVPIDTEGQPTFVDQGIRRADPKKPRRTPEAVAKNIEKIKAGEQFADVEVMPAVRLASQRVADEAVVTKNTVTLPAKDNAAILAMKPGEVLLAGAVQPGRRRGGTGDNVFGMMRKIKSVKQVGDQIVVETEHAKLAEVLSGSVALSGSLTEVAAIDTTGINLDDYFHNRVQQWADPLTEGGFEVKQGAWGLDKEVDLQGFQMGGEKHFKFKNAVNLDGVEQETNGELYVKAKAGLAIGVGFGFDIEGLFKDINYVRLYGYGKAYAEAGAGLTSASEAKGVDLLQEKVEELLEEIHMGNPVKAAGFNTIKLWETTRPGPGIPVGPVVIPTSFLIEVLVTCEVKASSTMTIVADAGAKAEVKVGIEYTSKDGVQPINEITFEKWAKFEMTDGSASVTLQCTVGPKIHWLVCDTAGPFIELKGGLRGTLQYDAVCKKPSALGVGTTPSASLGVLIEAGIIGAVGGGIDINDLFEIEFSWDLFEYWWELWKKTWWLPNPPVICPSDCNNGVQDNEEAGVDCGGVCKGCPLGAVCSWNGDCEKGTFCYTNGEKVGACSTKNQDDPCNDGKLNPAEQGIGEIDIDCGGKCGKCKAGQNCKGNDDCATGLCQETTGKCATWDCNNGAWDPGGETDVDCGGNCKAAPTSKACIDGKKCGYDDDCASGACKWFGTPDAEGALPMCIPAACKSFQDAIQSGTETGVNCGGPCVDLLQVGNQVCYKGKCGKDLLRCAKDQKCQVDNDCLSGNCILATGSCGGDIGSDGVMDGTETDIDCGGASKQKCGHNLGCAVDADCQKDLQCSLWFAAAGKEGSSKHCVYAYENGILEPGIESDVDCGAKVPTKCDPGKLCSSDADCLGEGLGDFACKKPTYGPQVCTDKGSCSNKKQDGLETGVDCGGDCETKCGEGSPCLINGDCLAGTCNVLQINDKGETVKGLCTGTCSNFKQDPGEGDVDCGGPCPAKCPLDSKCQKHADCADNFCLSSSSKAVAWTCAVSKCDDFVIGGQETDVDCGGGCAACKKGQKCKVGGDCESGICDAGKCGPKPCENGKLDAGETGIDCGGACKPQLCPDGQGCDDKSDCQWNICIAGICKYDTCFDGQKQLTEADTDCGGVCKLKCPLGKSCRYFDNLTSNYIFDAKSCQSGACKVTGPADSQCVSGPCADGQLSPGEVGIDCGPVCNNKCADGKGCSVASDCASGWCKPGGSSADGSSWPAVCQTPTCSDKTQNQDETSQDCGGTICAKCPPNAACKVAADCQSSDCSGGFCQFPKCENGVKDALEADVDCGGNCSKPCAYGHTCKVNSDCANGQCLGKPTSFSDAFICANDPCQDGKKNNSESDVDCGGSCPDKCAVGKLCNNGNDCAVSCNLATKKCVASKCEDGQLSWPGESDVDCGGVCATKCSVGQHGTKPSDCASGFADLSFKCVASGCEDGKLTPGETDIDCGGPCTAKCALAKGCKVGGDCQSNVCNGSACVAGSCWDGKKTDNEGDVDCGGACTAKCSTGKNCAANADCTSGVCSVGGSCVATTCDDGKLSGDESDVDCGGSCKTKCLLAAKCKGDGDCFSTACHSATKLCAASACVDGIQNKGETDLDCGGPCTPCAVGKGCGAEADCTSKACSVAGTCAKTTCEDGKLTQGESDVDCGGSCGATCLVGMACVALADCAAQACSDGKCGCLPGFSGTKCELKSDVCLADKLVCDDKNACTADSCDPKTGCVYNSAAQEGQSCDDGDTCTLASACKTGKCSGTVAKCPDDGSVCTLEACDQGTGACSVANKNCDDGNVCTDDSCDAVKGCANVANTGSCDDGNACTLGDKCVSKSCVQTPLTCNDGNACTSDVCNPASGCVYKNAADDSICGTNLICESGVCCPVQGGPIDFANVGAPQSYVVPSCATWVRFEVLGGNGGSYLGNTSGNTGGRGGYVTGYVSGLQGKTLSVNVGGGGGYSPSNGGSNGGNGGYNGGGGTKKIPGEPDPPMTTGGGGMSTIKDADGTYIIVAGGGGGANSDPNYVGATGGDSGYAGSSGSGVGPGTTAGGGAPFYKGGINPATGVHAGDGSAGKGGDAVGWMWFGGGGGGAGYMGGGGGINDCKQYDCTGAGSGGGGGGQSWWRFDVGGATFANGAMPGSYGGSGHVRIQWTANSKQP